MSERNKKVFLFRRARALGFIALSFLLLSFSAIQCGGKGRRETAKRVQPTTKVKKSEGEIIGLDEIIFRIKKAEMFQKRITQEISEIREEQRKLEEKTSQVSEEVRKIKDRISSLGEDIREINKNLENIELILRAISKTGKVPTTPIKDKKGKKVLPPSRLSEYRKIKVRKREKKKEKMVSDSANEQGSKSDKDKKGEVKMNRTGVEGRRSERDWGEVIKRAELEREKGLSEIYTGFRGRWVPPASFMPIKLLSAGEFPTGGAGMKNPLPVFAVPKGRTIIPGGKRIKAFERCSFILSGMGDISTSRVYMRLKEIICIDSVREKKITRIQGKAIVVDPYGLPGIEGEIVRREGQYIAYSMLASFLEGIAEMSKLLSAQFFLPFYPQFTFGGIPTTQFPGGFGGLPLPGQGRLNQSNVIQIALGEGVARAMERLANYYVSLAEKVMPVVLVPAGVNAYLFFEDEVKVARATGR